MPLGKTRHSKTPHSGKTRQAIANGVDIAAAPETVAQSERKNWTLFDEYHGHNVTQAYKELEWE